MRTEYAVPRKRVEAALRHYLKRLSPRVKIHKAILFGSYAKDSYSYDSDIDIAIIADGLPEDPGQRYALLKETILGLDLQPFAYTKKEWEMMLRNNSSFARQILRQGIDLRPES